MEYDNSLGKWIIDTDPGVDDAFALIYALHFIKDNLLALSIEGGNTGVDQCTLNAKKICVISNSYTPVYTGCKFNVSSNRYEFAEAFHGQDGLFDLDQFLKFEERFDKTIQKKYINETFPFLEECSPLKIIELCYKYDNVNILTLGPLTNIATAFMLDPNIVNRVNRIVLMGGSYTFSGNLVPAGEFNFVCDQIAVKVVLDNFKNITVYPWEPCMLHRLNEREQEACLFDNDRSSFCKQCIIKKKMTGEDGIFADYGAAVVAFYPKAVKKSKHVYADIIIDGSSHMNGGMVISHSNNMDKNQKRHTIEVVEELDSDIFYELFRSMIK